MRSSSLRAAALFVMVSHSLSAQRSNLASVNGVWRATEVRVRRPDSTYTRPPQAGLRIISDGYFSQIFYPATAAQGVRPTTADEKAARYDVVTANAGHFEMTDSTFVIHFDFSKAAGPSGATVTSRYQTRGDSLWETTFVPWAKDSTKRVVTTTKFIRIR